MLCYISPISFIIVAHLFLYPFSNANPSVEDKMLIAFVRNDQKIQISEYTKEKYEAYLGIMHFLRKNWQCEKIADEFDEYERTECQKYRKYLDILYEYLYREYVGIPTVKPKFVVKKEIEIEGPIIYAVNCLIHISEFYFKKSVGQKHEYKLNKMFNYYRSFEPKLLNEKRLNYEFKLKNESKLPINEMILQLAIDTANEWQTNESLDEIIQQKCGEIFEQYLKEMFKKVDDAIWIKDDKHYIIINSKFDDKTIWMRLWKEDALFSEFVKGLATNFVKFFRMSKEYSNYLCLRKEKGNIDRYEDKRMVAFELCEIEKMKEYLTQKYEAYLGVMYLMRENWHCDKIFMEFEKKKLCEKYQKYLYILYEYLFRLYAGGKSSELAIKFPAVKPIFTKYDDYDRNQMELISVIDILTDFSKYFWKKDKNHHYPLVNIRSNQLDLKNELELNYEIKEEENWFNKFKQNLFGRKNVQKGK